MEEGDVKVAADNNHAAPEQVTVVINEKESSQCENNEGDSNGDLKSSVPERRPSLSSDMEAFAPAAEGWLTCWAGKENSFAAKLVHCDRQYYPEGDWTKNDTRYLCGALATAVLWGCINVYFDKDSFLYNNTVNYGFWIKIFATLSFNIVIGTVVGYYVVTRDWNIGYGRKILHFCLFGSPVLVNSLFGALDTKVMGLSWLALCSQMWFIILLKPVRRRFPLPCMLIFRAIDRPKDRPYTICWLWAQAVLGFIALVLLQSFLTYAKLSKSFFVLPMLVNGIGDGLAEPVGIRYGKHKYQTRALWHNGRCCSGEFIRSFEGSACVFFTSILAVFAVYSEWANTLRFIVALFLVPIAMTAAEAFSPHTCDTPFIFLVATALICFLFEGIDDNFDPFSPDYNS